MGNINVVDALMRLARYVADQLWLLVGAVFDMLRHISALRSGMIMLAVAGVAFGVAVAMQRRLTAKLSDSPDESVSIWRQELRFSLPAVAIFIIGLPIFLVRWLIRSLRAQVSSWFGDDDSSTEDSDEDDQKDVSVVVATLGPSFMWAGLIVAGIFLLSWAAEPLLRYQLDLSAGYPAWQYVLIGDRPELQWYLPLSRFPYLGALCTAAIWMALWWWIARGVRIVLGSDLGANLADDVDNSGVLGSWRRWFGARKLFEPDASYSSWARWLPVAALPGLVWAWGTLSATPYRTGGSPMAVSTILWLSWAIHLNLSGRWHMVQADEQPDEDPEPADPRGWADVLDDLSHRLRISEPYTFDPPRPVEPLERARKPARPGLISPLLDEVLPEAADGFTHMQQSVLETVSHRAYEHVDPPVEAGELGLDQAAQAGQHGPTGDVARRNQIVLAPDGSGKTTLGMLAVCNHALVHTRSSLVVARDEAAAERFAGRIRQTLEPSTLRWTVRVRKAGSSLVNDLSQGIIPDVVVASLDQLVTAILHNPRTYAPFLKTLGLIVVDDVESFCGPVEIHTQLAFRRLTLRVRQLRGTHQLGDASAPAMLVMGVDSMHNTATWVQTLCGVEAATHVFDYPATPAPVDPEEAGRFHKFYQLGDFVTDGGQSLSVNELIESCERQEIPWHYRVCGDAHRRRGRRGLNLEQSPQFEVASPLDACVVMLAGHVSTVRREIANISRAGLHFEPVASQRADARQEDVGADSRQVAEPTPIAFVSVVDADERMALTELNLDSSLADIVDTLPRPVVRAPSGQAVEAHLAADLADTWMEVGDILEVFGNRCAPTLQRLARQELLAHEARTNLDADETDYETNLHVRVPSRAIASREDGQQGAGGGPGGHTLLPARVAQVERPCGPSVAIRDRTNLSIIERTDRAGARHVYYPGRIFETARGRYVVVGTPADAGMSGNAERPDSPVSKHDVLVEPFLNDDVSSPRRRTSFRRLDAGDRSPNTAENNSTAAAGNELTDKELTDKALADKHLTDQDLAGNELTDKKLAGDAEPVFIGDFPVAVSLGPVACRSRHLATFRLDPSSFEVRQRLVFTGPDSQKKVVDDTVETVALGIVANPDLDIVQRPDCPVLQLGEARLIAAAMRAVLPSMYRGSDVDIQVALDVADSPSAPPAAEDVLGPHDGFYLYDPHLGGNGAAEAIARDGVELLLRLCRVYLERVLYHEKLRARYDFWADEHELVGLRGHDDAADASTRRERDRRARKRALQWLDSRLRPEGSVTGQTRRANFGAGSEHGEGDVFDIGRCWYSQDGSVANLIWTKHRWLLDDQSEAMCDVGIGRETAAGSRSYDADSPAIADDLAWVRGQLENPAFELDDQTIWANPETVWSLDAGADIPSGSDAGLLTQEPVVDVHRLANAVACDSFEALAPLAQLLADRSMSDDSDAGPDGADGRVKLARFVADFVQGIPFADHRESDSFSGPIHALVYRRGNQQAQTLLLALLLRQVGIDAGLFLNPKTGRMLCGAALPPAEPADGQVAESADSAETMVQWRDSRGRSDRPLMWGELAAQPGSTGGRRQAFVPIATDRHAPVGVVEVDQPAHWVFLPLAAAWLRVGEETVEIPGVDA